MDQYSAPANDDLDLEDEMDEYDGNVEEECIAVGVPCNLFGEKPVSQCPLTEIRTTSSPVEHFGFELDKFWSQVEAAAALKSDDLPPDKRVVIELHWTAIPETLRAIIERK